MLWHKRLGNISMEKSGQRLTKENIILSLNFDDLGNCIDSIKGMFNRTKKKGAIKSQDLLEIHTNVNGCLTHTI